MDYEPSEAQYREFTDRVEALALDILGLRLVQWVMPVTALDDEMRTVEDTIVPQDQLLINTAGLLRYATVNCDYRLIQAHRDDD